MIKLSKVSSTLVASVLLAISGSAFAADGAATYTAKGCAACHGADGKSPILPA